MLRNEGGWDGSTWLISLLRIRRYYCLLSFFELNASSSRARGLYSHGVYYWRFGLLQEYSCVIINKLPLTTITSLKYWATVKERYLGTCRYSRRAGGAAD